MHFIADVEVRTYDDDYKDVDPRLLQQYYGVSQHWHLRAAAEATGVGHSDNDTDDKEDEDADGPVLDPQDGPATEDDDGDGKEVVDSVASTEEIMARLAYSQRRNLRHTPVEVPALKCPFSVPEMEESFWLAFKDAEKKGWLPDVFDIKCNEWATSGWGGYSESAQMKIGRKKK
ncbi:unnamed protein product, partial [Peniophora sp. CBMAI 1063]